MGSNYGSKVHFNESTSFDVDSGGQVVFAEGATLSMPVLGTTDYASTDVASGTTFPNTGVVILAQVRPTTAIYARTFTVKAPVRGCKLDIIVCTTASTECVIDINLGTGVGVLSAGTTSMPWIIASTDKSPSTYRSLSLVGLSTSLWGTISKLPSDTGWLFAATSS
jgi:hypothetical protein